MLNLKKLINANKKSNTDYPYQVCNTSQICFHMKSTHIKTYDT